MDDVSCPRCRTTKYRNPNLTLMVNVCGHALCESCVELLFVRGSGVCPVCNLPLRRINFRVQFFEDASIEKEIEIRKKVLKDYNLKEDDFPSAREYNDYLEEIESIIFNLVNDVEVESTKKKIEAYRKDNKEIIAKNRFKKSADEIFIETCLAQELANKGHGSNDVLKKLAQEKIERQKHQQMLIDDLMFSDASASDILQNHNELQRQQNEEQAKIEAERQLAQQLISSQPSSQTKFMPIPRRNEVLYKYTQFEIDFLGPEPPSADDVKHKGYLRNMRAATGMEKAGGYEAYLGCVRALQSAVEGLFLGATPAVQSLANSDDDNMSSGHSSDDVDID